MKQIQLQWIDTSISTEKYSLPFSPKTLLWAKLKILYRYFFKLKCQGIENLPQNQSYLIAANHSSHLDYAAIAIALEKQEIYALGAKDYFFNNAIKAWFFQTFFNVIPCNRNGNFLSSLRQCKRILKQGNPIVIFPEGTRSTTGEIQPFQSGLGLLAVKANVAIVPVYIDGTFQALPKGNRLPRRHPISISFGEPVNISEYQNKLCTEREVYQAIADDIQKAVMNLTGLTQN
jgi:1-acyl-sn-glycerol-3-phosphate acyltransferase